MRERTSEEGTLSGLLELVRYEFPLEMGYIYESAAGRTLILQFDESTAEDTLTTVESFLTDHGARFTRHKTTGEYRAVQNETMITFRVVLDNEDVSWDVTRDTRVEYRVNAVSEESALEHVDDLSVTNEPVTRVAPGEITIPSNDDARTLTKAHVSCVQLLTVETLVPQPENLKHPPTVTVIESDDTGERVDTHEFTTYDEITATEDTVTVTMGDRELTLDNAVIDDVAR